MYTILIILAIIVSLLLVFAVLIQNSKGGGLAANFAAGNQIFGVRQTADTLEKATWYLAVTLAVLCILAIAFPPVEREKSVMQGQGTEYTQSAQQGFEASQQQQQQQEEQTTTQQTEGQTQEPTQPTE